VAAVPILFLSGVVEIPMATKLALVGAVAVLSLAGALVALPAAERVEPRVLRIGTGAIGGTAFPIGSALADALSHPPGARPCAQGVGCGVPGLVAVAVSSEGGIANIQALVEGKVESAFVPADIAHWAFTGSPPFAGRTPARELRAIASLYQETLHLVARPGAAIASVADLAGRRVGLDLRGSALAAELPSILHAAGVDAAQVDLVHLSPTRAADKLRAGEIDALFAIGSWPIPALAELAGEGALELVAINGPARAALLERHPFFRPALIPAGAYGQADAVATVAAPVLWLVPARLDPDLVHELVRTLWERAASGDLAAGHAQAAEIARSGALDGIGVPLHPGASRYYRAAGLLPLPGGS
jgi:uncharacterized protein